MLSGLDTLLQAAQFLELQEQQQQRPPQRLNNDVSIIPTIRQSNGSSSASVHTNNSSNNTISFIPSNSTSISENRFLPPIGKISNGTVILTATGGGGQNGSSPARILSPMNGGSPAVGTTTTTAVVTGLVPQGTTAYLTTTTSTANNSSTNQQTVSSTSSSPRHQPGTATIVPVISSTGSRKRTISNASNHSSGGYGKDEPLVNGHSTAPPLVVISTNGSQQQHLHQKHHPALTIDLSTKSNGSSQFHPHHHRLSSTPPSSGCSSASSTLTISPVDDSQSSLNLSSGSSGYITSANSSTVRLSGAGSVDPSDCDQLLIDQNVFSSSSSSSSSHGSNSSPLPHDLVIVQQQSQLGHLGGAGQLTSTATLLGQVPTGGRRRTTSSNSNGVGTREVHNKLEKNRRAHLKECFEQLKKQLTLQPDEKKTSNLSILHAAIRHIQLLKRKEREYEHEMERLAKEKISAQNRILVLKREISQSQWGGEVDFSRLAPDTDAIPNGTSASSTTVVSSTGSGTVSLNGVVQQPSDRDLLNDPPGVAPGRNGIRYSSSSSLSSIATTASIGNLPLQTTISPVLIAASSPNRASPPSSATVARNTSPPVVAAAPVSGMPMPLSLTTKGSEMTHNGPSPLKTTTGTLPNGLNLTTLSNGISITNGSGASNCSTSSSSSTIGNGINGTSLPLIVGANSLTSLGQSQLFTPVTTILSAGNGAAIQTLPLNLNVAAAASNGSNGLHHHHHQQQLSGASSTLTANGSTSLVTSTATGLQIIGTTANGTTVPAGLVSSTTGKELIAKNGLRASDGNKIEIIATQTTAGSALEPPATKVIKLVNGNQLDKMMLSHVVQQGGIVVSPIQLLTSTQGLRVIQQAPNGLATIELSSPSNVQSQSSQVLRTTGGNNGISTNSTSHLSGQPASSHLVHPAHLQQQPQPPSAAQLHKLLLSSAAPNGTTTTVPTLNGLSSVSTTTITPELARLPGGAELNILPAGSNGSTTALPLYRTTAAGPQGKLTFVNAIPAGNGTGLTLKGTDSGRTAVHVVTPIQTSTAGQLSGLTPVVVSRYHEHQDKVVKTVGQSPSGLPLIAATPNAHYLSTVLKPTTQQQQQSSTTTTPSLVLVNSSSSTVTGGNQTTSITSKGTTTTIGEVTAIAI